MNYNNIWYDGGTFTCCFGAGVTYGLMKNNFSSMNFAGPSITNIGGWSTGGMLASLKTIFELNSEAENYKQTFFNFLDMQKYPFGYYSNWFSDIFTWCTEEDPRFDLIKDKTRSKLHLQACTFPKLELIINDSFETEVEFLNFSKCTVDCYPTTTLQIDYNETYGFLTDAAAGLKFNHPKNWTGNTLIISPWWLRKENENVIVPSKTVSLKLSFMYDRSACEDLFNQGEQDAATWLNKYHS